MSKRHFDQRCCLRGTSRKPGHDHPHQKLIQIGNKNWRMCPNISTEISLLFNWYWWHLLFQWLCWTPMKSPPDHHPDWSDSPPEPRCQTAESNLPQQQRQRPVWPRPALTHSGWKPQRPDTGRKMCWNHGRRRTKSWRRRRSENKRRRKRRRPWRGRHPGHGQKRYGRPAAETE